MTKVPGGPQAEPSNRFLGDEYGVGSNGHPAQRPDPQKQQQAEIPKSTPNEKKHGPRQGEPGYCKDL